MHTVSPLHTDEFPKAVRARRPSHRAWAIEVVLCLVVLAVFGWSWASEQPSSQMGTMVAIEHASDFIGISSSGDPLPASHDNGF